MCRLLCHHICTSALCGDVVIGEPVFWSVKYLLWNLVRLRVTAEKELVNQKLKLVVHMDMRVALVNKGNVMYNRGDFEKAREFYREALQNDSSCVEALYNFGNNTDYLQLAPCHHVDV